VAATGPHNLTRPRRPHALATPNTADSAASCHSRAQPAAMSTAARPTDRAQPLSETSSTSRRDTRSATVPPASSSSTTAGRVRALMIRARSSGLPVSRSTSSGRATVTMPLPASDTVCPLHSNAKSRCRSAAVTRGLTLSGMRASPAGRGPAREMS
jgi:hypothetical protein